jgi:hypothetical protein
MRRRLALTATVHVESVATPSDSPLLELLQSRHGQVRLGNTVRYHAAACLPPLAACLPPPLPLAAAAAAAGSFTANCKHFAAAAAAAAAAACLLCGGSAAAAVLVHRKKRPVRIRPKNVVALHKKMIQRGAKVKEAAERIGSGAPDGQDVWDRGKTMAENYAVSLMLPREMVLLMVLQLLSVVPVPCTEGMLLLLLLDAAGCCWMLLDAAG